MKKFSIYFSVVLCLGISCLCGCGKNPDNNIAASETDNTKQTTNAEIESTEQIITDAEIKKTINIDKAAENLDKKLQDPDIHLRCESVEFNNIDLENRCYYIFRGYNDFSDHRATVGWYAVDVETGECFNTNVLTEWTAME